MPIINTNTGEQGWTTLEEYYLDNPTELTGNEKPNEPEDADYAPNIINTTMCP